MDPPDYHTVADLKDQPRYRRAFEEKVANIDWESSFAGWRHGPFAWSGLSWEGLEKRHLLSMWSYVECGDFDGLEAAYRADCRKHAGEATTTAIAALRFDRYQRDAEAGLRCAVAAVGRHAEATSIYLRVKSDWSSEFHVAEDPVVEPFEPREESSYTGPLEEFEGPDVDGAAALYNQLHDEKLQDPGGAKHYLAARVVSAFGRVAAATPSPVPVYVSVLSAVFRVSSAG